MEENKKENTLVNAGKNIIEDVKNEINMYKDIIEVYRNGKKAQKYFKDKAKQKNDDFQM